MSTAEPSQPEYAGPKQAVTEVKQGEEIQKKLNKLSRIIYFLKH